MTKKARQFAAVKVDVVVGNSEGYFNEGLCFTWRSADFSVYLDQ